MPKVILHPTVRGLSGKMGDVVFRYNKKTRKTSISKKPDMTKVKWSKAQKANRQRFKLAIAYAKAALAEPKVRVKYERRAKKQGKRPWDVALSDYFQGKDLLARK